MAGEISKENGKNGGRPVGSTTKPQIKDYMSKNGVEKLMKTAHKMAGEGDSHMLKFLLDQYFGKARQSLEMTGKDGEAIEIESTLSPEAEKAISDTVTKAFLDNTKV